MALTTAAEREIVITVADDEQSWHVFTDSKRALSRRLLKVAESLGVTVTPCGEGFEFDLPLNALSVRVPRKASAAQSASLVRARAQRLRFAPEMSVRTES